MSYLVCSNALITCSMSMPPNAPGTLTVVRPPITTGGQPAANIMDMAVGANIKPWSMCNSTTNPTVIAATAAAQGVHTPAACVPTIPKPWAPGASKVTIDKMAALHDGCTLNCAYQGVIKVSMAGQVKVTVK